MKKLLVALCAVAFLITACSKEPSFENLSSNPGSNQGGGGNNGTKLVRYVNRVGDDSAIVEYSYNAANRITLITYSGVANGEPIDIRQTINRNAANVITSTVLKSPFFLSAGFGTDSLVTKYEYDAVTGHYVRALLRYVLDDEAQSDSAVLNYDNASNLASTISYIGDSTGYAIDTKTEYTYAGSNIASAKNYIYTGSAFVLDQTETYEYDSKANPSLAASDAPVLGMGIFYSANNPTKRTVTSADSQESLVTNINYTYNANNLPATAVSSDSGNTTTVNYYYQ